MGVAPLKSTSRYLRPHCQAGISCSGTSTPPLLLPPRNNLCPPVSAHTEHLSASRSRRDASHLAGCCADTPGTLSLSLSTSLAASPSSSSSSSCSLFSLFCSSEGTCYVEVTLGRPQLQKRAREKRGRERKEEREREHFCRGDGEGEPALCSVPECTTSLSPSSCLTPFRLLCFCSCCLAHLACVL